MRIKLGWLLVLVVLVGCDAGEERPNILLIVLDDFGYNDLAINNDSDSPTPTLDQLAREGIRFTRHYTESVCTPSRIALLSGRYPAKLGFHPVGSGLAPEVETLPDALGRQGYTSHMIGKWHAGDAHRESRPEFNGFDHWFGFMNQLYLAGPHENGVYARGRPTYRNPWLENEKGELRQHPGHLTDLLTDHALDVMRSEANPWFIYLSYYAPHTPLQPSQKYLDKFGGANGNKFQAVKAQLDSSIARLFEQLRESREWDNTMVVVVSDNGGTAAHYPSNLPFAGVKAGYQEGGVRTPLIMSWPGHWEGGQVRDDTTMIFDLYPSITSALGIQAPLDLDGRDIFAEHSPRELHWYSHNAFGDIYSILSDDGQWRFNNWVGVVQQLLHQSQFVVSGAGTTDTDDSQRAQDMDESMRVWVEAATRVNDLQAEDSNGWRAYSGDAFRRTPLLLAHSMGFAFRSGSSAVNAIERSLVLQEGYIDIRESGDHLLITIDGNPVEVDLSPRGERCTSVVINSYLAKDNLVFYKQGDISSVQVYVDGRPVLEGEYKNHTLNPASPRNPLRVKISSEKGWYMPPSAQPFLSTRFLGEQEIADSIHPELMRSCENSESN
jgi:arylsulfatase A-like enzyme